ncbi:DedA family protein [Schaalia sp. lx-260]|uniref:DedA family protein n=1 Tax=Schaalia sp. lx-260 TaxID=2899082 RepID=UPI001E5AB64D|nr:hypothetical protein [Schaalia sp. lx-260]MCD4549450.1 hypothetical protein [Schaalia sp. lx-260]
MMFSWISSGFPLFIFLFFVVFFRAQLTYWLGRAAAHGFISAEKRTGFLGAIARWFNGPTPRKGAHILDKWGLVVIPLCFLTVGVQTAVNAGAGLVRLHWRTYTLAMIPGCIAWAILYSLGLLTLWTSTLQAIAGSPWGWAGITTVLLVFGGLIWHTRLRRNKESVCPITPSDSESAELSRSH